jgi:short subunit dehydrogenase-like uncharacterized protein
MAERPLAVLGATGYTGGLVVERAREAGLPLRLVGRRRDALEALARAGEEVRVADARDSSSVATAVDGAFAVASLAGPFLEVGFGPVEAALSANVHYLDTSAEQAFAREIYERFDSRAREQELVLLTSFGFDYVPGDLAARLAADGLEPVDEIDVAYGVRGVAVSGGTLRTMSSLMRQGHVCRADGRLVESRFGATTRRFRFPRRERSALEWGGTEPLTVPRHTAVRTVRSYVCAPRAVAPIAPIARVGAPFLRLAARAWRGSSHRARERSTFGVVAEARGSGGARRVTLNGGDFYGLTALLIVRAAEALRGGEVRKAGALAPAEAFEPRALIERLDPLLRLHSAVDL